jgi:hypothetical protein
MHTGKFSPNCILFLFSEFISGRGMEENGSEGIDEVIRAEAVDGKFLSDVDFFCISVRVVHCTGGILNLNLG